MPETKLFKVKNVSESDRTLAGRLVVADEVIEVPEDEVYGLTCQTENWAPADGPAKKVHEKAHAAQVAAYDHLPSEETDTPEGDQPKGAEKETD